MVSPPRVCHLLRITLAVAVTRPPKGPAPLTMGEPAGQCSLLGGPAALLAQLLLALIAVAGLMLKR